MTQRGGTTSVTAPQAQPHRNKRFDAGQVRVGVVGTSWWADSMYLPALAEHPAGRCVAVCGRNEATATELAERWNLPVVVFAEGGGDVDDSTAAGGHGGHEPGA